MRGEETAGTGGSAIEIDTPRRPSRSTDAGPVGRRALGGRPAGLERGVRSLRGQRTEPARGAAARRGR
ncbi:hypothetical protein AQ475_28125 [Burkholderia thailandensis]|nr:hypothetical protein AQ475_28125 [Burkholderia thailandensis]